MQLHRFITSHGTYGLATAPEIDLSTASRALTGIVHIGKGTRSPETGTRTSGAHELGYVIRGRVLIETKDGSFEAQAGDVIVTSPAELHSTTALEDSALFFVLIDPDLAIKA